MVEQPRKELEPGLRAVVALSPIGPGTVGSSQAFRPDDGACWPDDRKIATIAAFLGF